MWIADSESKIREAVASGRLEETASLDFKRELTSKSISIAIDIAAMSTDGGVLVYGIEEDENGIAAGVKPFELKNQADRIQQIANSCIQEPPRIQIKTIPLDDEPNLGFLVVSIPASPRAPHMVQVKRDNRFYGRGGRENRILSEGDVARLYERRQRWEKEAGALLEETIDQAPLRPNSNFAYLHAVAGPVLSDDRLLERGLGGPREQEGALRELVNDCHSIEDWQGSCSPFFRLVQIQPTADGWAIQMGTAPVERQEPERTLEVEVFHSGRIKLFCGRAGQRGSSGHRQEGPLGILEECLAGWTFRFCHLAGRIYRQAAYHGMLELGIAITGLLGAQSHWLNKTWFDLGLSQTSYRHEKYLQSHRQSASELWEKPSDAAEKLLQPFLRATTRGSYSPFRQERQLEAEGVSDS